MKHRLAILLFAISIHVYGVEKISTTCSAKGDFYDTENESKIEITFPAFSIDQFEEEDMTDFDYPLRIFGTTRVTSTNKEIDLDVLVSLDLVENTVAVVHYALQVDCQLPEELYYLLPSYGRKFLASDINLIRNYFDGTTTKLPFVKYPYRNLMSHVAEGGAVDEEKLTEKYIERYLRIYQGRQCFNEKFIPLDLTISCEPIVFPGKDEVFEHIQL